MLLEIRNLLKQITDTLSLQSANSLKESPDMQLSISEKRNMEKDIENIYKEYQTFMKTTDMPIYELYFKKKCNRNLELASVECEQGIYHLYVSDEAYSRKNKKEILFHEFTHIYDKEYLSKEYCFNKDGDRKTYVYTEIHAEQIKFLHMLGAEVVDSNLQNASHNTNVFDLDGNEQSFYTYLENFKKNLENHYIKEVYKTQSKKVSVSKDVIGSMATKFLYYFGALTIYKRISDYQIEKLADMEKFDKCWNIKISDVLEFYLNHNLDKSDRTTLKKMDIINVGDIIMCEWLNSAKDKYIITK